MHVVAGDIFNKKIALKNCKNPFENNPNQIMGNFTYIQKNISASIKTLQIKLLLSKILLYKQKNHFKRLPFTPVGVRAVLRSF